MEIKGKNYSTGTVIGAGLAFIVILGAVVLALSFIAMCACNELLTQMGSTHQLNLYGGFCLYVLISFVSGVGTSKKS